MLKPEMVALIQLRIEREEYSARLYEYMQLRLNNLGFKNLTKLYAKYSEEERKHASKAKDFLLSYGIQPVLAEIPAPECDCKTLADVFNETLKHEQTITEECESMAIASIGSPTVYTLALWYCSEQVEELDKARQLVDMLKVYGDNGTAYAMIEHLMEN